MTRLKQKWNSRELWAKYVIWIEIAMLLGLLYWISIVVEFEDSFVINSTQVFSTALLVHFPFDLISSNQRCAVTFVTIQNSKREFTEL